MTQTNSLADLAVDTIAAVKAMDEGIELGQPECGVVLSLQRQAEQILTSAFRQAVDLTYSARSVRAAVKEAAEDAAKAGEK